MKTIITVTIIASFIYFAYQGVQQTQAGNNTSSVSAEAAQTTDAETISQTEEPALQDLQSDAAEGAAVYFIEPADGATTASPVTVKFGIKNMTVAKAGVDQPNSGHHHLLINVDELPDLNAPLPANENLIHFGGGQTETTIELTPGEHTLQLLLGNYLHIPHTDPVISEKITITVE